jgi:hypothetical protein
MATPAATAAGGRDRGAGAEPHPVASIPAAATMTAQTMTTARS